MAAERAFAGRRSAAGIAANQPTHTQPLVAALAIEAPAWTADNGERAAILMGAAEYLLRSASGVTTFFNELSHYHDECERKVRRTLGDRGFDAAFRRGQGMGMSAAVSYALGEPPTTAPHDSATALTRHELEVAHLVAQGLTNKQIAAKLVLSQRTARHHVEHILSKLGFTGRTQIAAWIVDEAEHEGSRPLRGAARGNRNPFAA